MGVIHTMVHWVTGRVQLMDRVTLLRSAIIIKEQIIIRVLRTVGTVHEIHLQIFLTAHIMLIKTIITHSLHDNTIEVEDMVIMVAIVIEIIVVM